MNDRQKQILHMVETGGDIQLQELKDVFPEVSMMTLRRDLIHLEEQGSVVRTYGGAISTKRLCVFEGGEENSYFVRAEENVSSKQVIAEKAVPFVEKGRSIFLDSGSTLMCLARIIPDDSYSIITSGANIAMELIKKLLLSVVVLGGQVNRNTLSTSGPNALSLLDTMNIDIAFMAASGFSSDSGFTVANIYECELKRKVVSRAKKIILLMDSSKINKVMPFTYASLADIDLWICESSLPEDLKDEAAKAGVTVL